MVQRCVRLCASAPMLAAVCGALPSTVHWVKGGRSRAGSATSRPEALSVILGRRVESVTHLEGAAGTSTRARLGLTGDGLPPSVFVKMPAAGAGIRMLGELAGLGETEARFYRELAPELVAGVPRSYGSAFDSLTGRFVVVLEDMSTSPCQFPGHPAPAGSRPNGPTRRGTGGPARDVLGPVAAKARWRWAIQLAAGAIGRPGQSHDPRGAANVGTPPGALDVDTGARRPLHLGELRRRHRRDRLRAAHRLARRLPPWEHLLPRRPGRPAGLAGRPARPSVPRPRLRDRAGHTGQRSGRCRTRPTRHLSQRTGRPGWPAPGSRRIVDSLSASRCAPICFGPGNRRPGRNAGRRHRSGRAYGVRRRRCRNSTPSPRCSNGAEATWGS